MISEVSAGDVLTAVSKDAEQRKLLLKESAMEKLGEQKEVRKPSPKAQLLVGVSIRERGVMHFEMQVLELKPGMSLAYFQLIVSLQKRIAVLNDALHEAGERFFDKTVEIETLHKKLADQVKTTLTCVYVQIKPSLSVFT